MLGFRDGLGNDFAFGLRTARLCCESGELGESEPL